jgi:hypothetical protein
MAVTYLQCSAHLVQNDVLERMLLEQKHAFDQIYVFLLSDFIFCYSSFPKRVFVDFWSQHLWINVELNNKNKQILV